MSEEQPNQDAMSYILVLLFLFSLSFGSIVLSAEKTTSPSRTYNTDTQCRSLAHEILELENIEKSSIQKLIACLEHEYFYELHRGAAKSTLLKIGEPALPALIAALKNRKYTIAEGAAIVLGMMGDKAKEAIPALIELLRSNKAPNGLSKYNVSKAIGKIGEIDFLIRALQGKETGISSFIASHGIMGAGANAEKAIPVLLEMLNSGDASIQSDAANALGAIGEASYQAIPRLKVLSNSKHNFVRRSAGEALIKIGTPEAMDAATFYMLRKFIFNEFFKAMSVFNWNPWLAGGIGILIGSIALLTTTLSSKKTLMIKLLYLPASLWLMYAVWEFYAMKQGANIRVDLLFIYPFLASITVIGFVLWLIGIRSRK